MERYRRIFGTVNLNHFKCWFCRWPALCSKFHWEDLHSPQREPRMTSPNVTSTLQSEEFLSLVSASPQRFISYLAPTAYQYKAEPSLKSLLSSSALMGLLHTGIGFWHHLLFSNRKGIRSLTMFSVCILCSALQVGFSTATSSKHVAVLWHA